ncbi:LuxR family transcriptional regulator [Actinokineospora sp. NBRC 105648]|uniref:LuxR C-terminal-related transcriptional regulator n=1 Tax=Actinokineospora sp. NBRC 105648 TaxID=3032206 RepID=UPI0024A4BBEE|nr:LuxR family transcriptional regulator [Actinokineospora sp. NBRC 105648]GLZ39752.1 hypothetical protein Acsp05_33760 [Actinokineospora sp. NBRC 105648]
MGAPARERVVGREQELSALRRALDALVAGRAQVVEIHGEPGIGKTRLLAQLADLADSRGLRVLFPAVSRQWSERKSDDPATVLAVDDAHSAHWLDGVLRVPPPGPVLLAVGYRDGCVWLPAALARSPWPLTRLSPGPLGPAEVAALLPGTPAHECRALAEAGGGNPLYLRALSRVAPSVVAALLDPDRVGEAPLPDRVLAVAVGELHGLARTPREVAYAVAAAGTPADLDVVVRVAGLPESVVLRAVDELVAAGLVAAHGPRLRFRHPLVRAAAYQSAGVTWRTQAHRRAGEYLRACDGPLPLRAFHAVRTAGYGDTEAAETLAAAANAVLHSAPATAATWVERAVDILPADRAAPLLPLLGQALSLSGDLARGRDVLHRALVHNGPDRAAAVRACARTERLLGRYAEAKALLDNELDRADSPDTAGIAAERATVALLLGDTAGCTHYAGRALAAGDEAAGHVLAGLGAVRSGATSVEGLPATVRLVDGLPDSVVGDHLAALAWLELESGHPTDAARHLRRGLDFARATGRRSTLPTLLTADAALAVRTGALVRARASASEAGRIALALGSPELAAMAAAAELPCVLWQEGPVAALAAAPAPQSRWSAELVDLAVAEIHLAAGDFTACAEHVTRAVGGDLSAASPRERPAWAGHLAVALAHLGRAEEALHLVRGTAVGSLARALVFACLDHPGAARAEALLATAADPLTRARAHELLAELLAAEGELTAARAELGKAKEGYLSCGATWLSIRLRGTETRLGARAPRPRRPLGTVEALSGRELEIAELVASGLTNREVATRLFLSSKTVEGHLARVFTKLGVKSRMGVAQRLSARS